MTLTADPPVTQFSYSVGAIVYALTNYLVLSTGARPPSKHERLVTKPPPAYEAPSAPTSRLLADVEWAMRKLSMREQLMVWDAYGWDAFRDNAGERWSRVADRWSVTRGQARLDVGKAVDAMLETLNAPRPIVEGLR